MKKMFVLMLVVALAVPTVVLARESSTEPVSVSHWQKGFLEGLEWGMDGDEVDSILAKKGFDFYDVSESKSRTGKTIQTALVPGRPLYGKVRVRNVYMSFAKRKLISVHMFAVDGPRGALYEQTRVMFGAGMTSSSPASRLVRERMESPKNSYTSERYFFTTAVTSKLGYEWVTSKGRHVRTDTLKLSNWILEDIAYGNDSSSRFDRFQKSLKDKAAGKRASCEKCNGRGSCVTCGGKGYSVVDGYRKCWAKYCKGNGRYRVHGMGGGIKTCGTCKGTGRIKTGKKEKVNCSSCNATGKCSRCGGKGK